MDPLGYFREAAYRCLRVVFASYFLVEDYSVDDRITMLVPAIDLFVAKGFYGSALSYELGASMDGYFVGCFFFVCV